MSYEKNAAPWEDRDFSSLCSAWDGLAHCNPVCPSFHRWERCILLRTFPPLLLSLAALAMLSQSAYDAWRQKEKRNEGHRHKVFLHTRHDKRRWQCISIHSYSPSSTMTELELSWKPMWYRIKRYPDTGVSVYPVLHNLYCKCDRTFLL